MRQEISRMTSLLLWDAGAIKVSTTSPFRVASGKLSPLYVDCRLLVSDPVTRDLITSFAHWMYESEALGADCIAGGVTGGVPFAAWLAERVHKPFVYVRKEPKGYGTSSQIEGELRPGSVVLLCEDLITDGKSKLDFLTGIDNAQCTVKDCLVVFDRQQGGKKELAHHGVTLHTLTDIETALRVGRENGYITEADLQTVRAYLESTR